MYDSTGLLVWSAVRVKVRVSVSVGGVVSGYGGVWYGWRVVSGYAGVWYGWAVRSRKLIKRNQKVAVMQLQ